MSRAFKHKLWVSTKKDIEQLIQRQNILKRVDPLPRGALTFKLFSEMFILYTELSNKLGILFSKTFQYQKRKVVRTLIESANKRLLELKAELKNAELSEYIYADNAIISRKLTPFDLFVWRSPNFLYRRPPDLQKIVYGNKPFLDQSLEKEHQLKAEETLISAVNLIQANERARQARIYKANVVYDHNNIEAPHIAKAAYKFVSNPDNPMSIPVKRTIFNPNYIKNRESCCNMEKDDAIFEIVVEDPDRPELMEAARKIQNAWRIYKNKKILKSKFVIKETIYGVVKRRRLVNENRRYDDIVQTYKDEIFKKQLEEEYVKFMLDERTRILQQRSPWLMEDISDHIRSWFREFYDKLGQIHTYPDPIKSGTVLVLIDESYNIDEFKEKLDQMKLSKEEKKKLAEKAKSQKEKEKAKIKKAKMQEAKRRKKMKAAGIIDLSDELSNNKNIQVIMKTIQEYSIDWKLIDEFLNSNEIIKDWVTETEKALIHRELRALVDEFMRIEYEIVQQAICLDLKKKYKPLKVKKQKEKKPKKGKKVKDLTEGRSLQSLYEELEKVGVIQTLKPSTFQDFIGDFNFVANDLRDEDLLTTTEPTKGDIKLALQDCMLGMGEFEAEKPKAICLIGPPNSGKALLCKIIASELDAVFIDLSPEKTVLYADDLKFFIQVILKLAKALQPTIFFIRNVHRVFWKKVPADQAAIQPKLLEGSLAKKILKQVKNNEKIMLLATSNGPWAGKPKMKKLFQKFILIPPSDYGSSFLIWLEYVTQFADEHKLPDCDISTLARFFRKYVSGDVTDNVESTLSLSRRMQLGQVPIDPHEFLSTFLNRENPLFPPEDKLYDKFTKYFKASNKMAKLRKAFLKKKAERSKKK